VTQLHPVFSADQPSDPPRRLAAVSDSPAIARASLRRQPLWAAQYRIVLFTLDLCAIIIATTVGLDLHFGSLDAAGQGRYYLVVSACLVGGWLIALVHYGCYEIRHLASGAEEAKRVLRASAALMMVLAVVGYAFQLPLARGFVIGVIPLGALILLVLRAAVRQFVTDRRERGGWTHRIIAVGTTDSVEHLLTVTERAKGAGLQVVGVCVEDAEVGTELRPGVPVLGGVLDAAQHAVDVDADVVAVTGSGLGPTGVRELGWQLEGTRRGLVIAPSLTAIAGTRMHISPVEGLPLMWLDRPQLGRLPRLLKRSVDLVGALVLLTLLAPVLVAAAIAIKCTSRGPVLFRQRRLGVNGTEFDILKFRTMCVGAECRREEFLDLNDQDGSGVLFKIREDPRVTQVGKWIRRFSIDEMPQLLQVLTGTMSLVGPRPLAVQDSIYTGSARRRLMVRPGLTGLWQISGRSDISWADAVRLDLYYVENWSLGLDLSILFRTVIAVIGRKGAY
jgi:exopolysaccharide biosynthesis polyprenyl glycosylphosphotransferase